MLKDARGSMNGAVVTQFEGGKEYEVPDDLALCFTDDGSAELVSKKTMKMPGA